MYTQIRLHTCVYFLHIHMSLTYIYTDIYLHMGGNGTLKRSLIKSNIPRQFSEKDDIYIYICMCVYIHMYIYVYTNTLTNTCMILHIRMSLTYVYTDIYLHMGGNGTLKRSLIKSNIRRHF
jgi:hypothetical protein